MWVAGFLVIVVCVAFWLYAYVYFELEMLRVSLVCFFWVYGWTLLFGCFCFVCVLLFACLFWVIILLFGCFGLLSCWLGFVIRYFVLLFWTCFCCSWSLGLQLHRYLDVIGFYVCLFILWLFIYLIFVLFVAFTLMGLACLCLDYGVKCFLLLVFCVLGWIWLVYWLLFRVILRIRVVWFVDETFFLGCLDVRVLCIMSCACVNFFVCFIDLCLFIM